jgi:LPXTG-motif cell wall-anchored protein
MVKKRSFLAVILMFGVTVSPSVLVKAEVVTTPQTAIEVKGEIYPPMSEADQTAVAAKSLPVSRRQIKLPQAGEKNGAPALLSGSLLMFLALLMKRRVSSTKSN